MVIENTQIRVSHLRYLIKLLTILILINFTEELKLINYYLKIFAFFNKNIFSILHIKIIITSNINKMCGTQKGKKFI